MNNEQVTMSNEQIASSKWQRRLVFLCSLLIAHCSFCFAQSTATEIETLLGTKSVTNAQAARFLLEASEIMITSDPDEAFRYAQEHKWLPKNATADGVARLDDVSLLLMRSFDMKGGLLYSLTKSPHYAYRQLTYNSVIQGRADPAMNVSGERLLFITGRVLSALEAVEIIILEN
jgi:hypothetical protein